MSDNKMDKAMLYRSDGRINEAALTKRVAEREGGKVNLNIAELSGVLNIVLSELSHFPASKVLELIEDHSEV